MNGVDGNVVAEVKAVGEAKMSRVCPLSHLDSQDWKESIGLCVLLCGLSPAVGFVACLYGYGLLDKVLLD